MDYLLLNSYNLTIVITIMISILVSIEKYQFYRNHITKHIDIQQTEVRTLILILSILIIITYLLNNFRYLYIFF